ncbi:MAG: hypothetical protein LC720_08740, partial [Actinobacteria bacterium]|nr:hypothetical protein [Actinomycetota bacterium]
MDIDSYRSPEAEALLLAAQTRGNRRVSIGHEVLTHGLAAIGFAAAAAGLAVFAPWARPLSVATLVLTIAMYAVAANVRFPVGSGWANPTQLVFVPMLF